VGRLALEPLAGPVRHAARVHLGDDHRRDHPERDDVLHRVRLDQREVDDLGTIALSCSCDGADVAQAVELLDLAVPMLVILTCR